MAAPAVPAKPAGPAPLLIRVLMIGESSVGKTSLVLRYDKRGFNAKFTTTIGVDYSDRLITVDDKPIKLQIWDTAGQVSDERDMLQDIQRFVMALRCPATFADMLLVAVALTLDKQA